MTIEEQNVIPSAEDRARMRKQMADHAVRLAVNSRWEEAVNLNREYVRLFPDESDAFNRLGKALGELGKINDALAAYRSALELDDTNTIARRNLDRLATMKKARIAAAPSQVDTRLVVEPGKAAVANLQAIDPMVAVLLDAGDAVDLQVKGNAVNIHALSGEYLGMVEPRIGIRLAKLMEGGNEYSAAIASTSGDEPRVIIRETSQHPSLIDRVSFPQSVSGEVRPYTRKSVLKHQLADDLDYSEDDEPKEEEEERSWTETSEETDTATEQATDVEAEEEFE